MHDFPPGLAETLAPVRRRKFLETRVATNVVPGRIDAEERGRGGIGHRRIQRGAEQGDGSIWVLQDQ
jgi:hypothetical protein